MQSPSWLVSMLSGRTGAAATGAPHKARRVGTKGSRQCLLELCTNLVFLVGIGQYFLGIYHTVTE